jgi:hypothetical protein
MRRWRRRGVELPGHWILAREGAGSRRKTTVGAGKIFSMFGAVVV